MPVTPGNVHALETPIGKRAYSASSNSVAISRINYTSTTVPRIKRDLAFSASQLCGKFTATNGDIKKFRAFSNRELSESAVFFL